MVHISNVYTRTGDDGTTDLGDGERIPKGDPRLDSAGDLDELVCALGMALSLDNQDHEVLREIQNQLFDLPSQPSLSSRFVQELEDWCDDANEGLAPLSSWVLPGGDLYPAAVHQARAICRRAERRYWDTDDKEIARYLNRLSDFLFILARRSGTPTETLWVPEYDRRGAQ
ncbi:MAG: cob(I)yrinic acid a,c-diamide adenosyltransferase [bacterium]|nr:cob(I)yrinic acid a,c-diamide adenosyltransferase [bacterium]